MSGINLKPAVDPAYIPLDFDFYGNIHSEIESFEVEYFKIMDGDYNGDKARYQEFMMKFLDPKNRMKLNDLEGFTPVKETWTREGDLIKVVEYVILKDPKDQGADSRSY